MKKLFEKHETLLCILLIFIYVYVNSYCIYTFSLLSYKTTIINTILSILLYLLILKLDGVKYYGLIGVKNSKKYLYFIPLIVLGSVNLWNGFNISNKGSEILFYIITMFNVGFLEEVIFRGFLFKMMSKSNIKTAIIVSSLTFGFGHIVNLLNGADVASTLIQICYAVALGFLFVIIFHKSKSLLPAIFTHIAINATSIFNTVNTLSLYVIPIIIVIICISYSLYINKTIK